MAHASADFITWLSKAGLQTASSGSPLSPDEFAWQAAAADPGLVLQAMLADQQGLVLLLQQLSQHKDAFNKLSSLYCGEKPSVPDIAAALSSLGDAATPAQLQQLVENLLQLMQPATNCSTAEGAAIALEYLHDQRTKNWGDPESSSGLEMHSIILSVPNQLLLAKALEHSSNEVVEAAVSLIQAWIYYEPWRRDDGEDFTYEFDSLLQLLRKELQQDAPWAAHWYLASMRFTKYEPQQADYAAMIAAAAAEVQSLQQGLQHCRVQSVYALATASCLANSDDRDLRMYGSDDHRRRDVMLPYCSPAAALWLFGAEGLEAVGGTAEQKATAADTVVQGTKQVLAVLQQALEANSKAQSEALGVVLKRVLFTATTSTGMADSDWLLPALKQLTRPTGSKEGAALFRDIVEAVPTALQQQLMTPVLHDLKSSDAAVASAAAAHLSDALASDPNAEADTFGTCLAQQHHWELLLQAWNSGGDAVAEAVQDAVSEVWGGYAGCLRNNAKPTQPHVLQSIGQLIQFMQQGDLKAAELMYHMSKGRRNGQQLLQPHISALLSAAAADGSLTQAAALAIVCELCSSERAFKAQLQEKADDMPANLRLWILGDGTSTDPCIPALGFPSSFVAPPAQVDTAAASDDPGTDRDADLEDLGGLPDGPSNLEASLEGSPDLLGDMEDLEDLPDLPNGCRPPEMPAMQLGVAAGPFPVAAADAWPGQAAWEQRMQQAREASAAAAADRAVAAAATAAEAAACDAAAKLPRFVVEFLGSGYRVQPSNRQQRWQKDVTMTVLGGLAKAAPVTLLTAVLQHGWLPALRAIQERSTCGFTQVSHELGRAAAPEQVQQLVPLLLQHLADTSGPTAVAAAKQADTLLVYKSCVCGILAQQQHWQLLLQLLQHKEEAVAKTAVRLVARVVMNEQVSSSQPHVSEVLPQLAEALRDGSIAAANLFDQLTGSWASRPERPYGLLHQEKKPTELRMLLPLMPQLHAAAAAACDNRTNCRLAALQTLRVLCKLEDGWKALGNQDCRYLLDLVQLQGSQLTTDSAALAAAAANVIKYLPWDPPGVQLLLSGHYTPQLLQAVLQHTEALQTATAQQRTQLRSCCELLMQALSTLISKPDGWPLMEKHMLEILIIMQKGEPNAAATAGEIALECLEHDIDLDIILQQQHVDVLVSCLRSQHDATREQAAELLAHVVHELQCRESLLLPQTLDNLFAAASTLSGGERNPDAADVVELIAAVLDHFCTNQPTDQLSEQLDRLLKPHHLQQLATAAAYDTSAAPEATMVLAQLGSMSSWKMQLQLAQVRPLLQEAVEHLQQAAAAAKAEAERMQLPWLQAAMVPGQQADLYMQHVTDSATLTESAAEKVREYAQQIQGVVASAVEVVTGKLTEAKNSMHEVAGQFAEQYAAYRALRSEYSSSRLSSIGAGAGTGAATSTRVAAKRQQLDAGTSNSIETADVAQRTAKLQQQLTARSDALVVTLGELVAAADSVNGLKDLLQCAQ